MSNKNMLEIERKFLVAKLPNNLHQYEKLFIRQGYISTDPTMRLRQQNDRYFFTFKGSGNISKLEFEYELDEKQFNKLWEKLESSIITKTRYLIPIESGLTAELDIYEDDLDGFINAEVEFSSMDEAEEFIPPKWFGREISMDRRYSNASLSVYGAPGINRK